MCYSPIEIPYGDKDQKGDYTLQSGDLVEFNIATDRRDKLQRATNILLVEDTFKVNGEKREKVSTSRANSIMGGGGFKVSPLLAIIKIRILGCPNLKQGVQKIGGHSSG